MVDPPLSLEYPSFGERHSRESRHQRLALRLLRSVRAPTGVQISTAAKEWRASKPSARVGATLSSPHRIVSASST
jgi:hypothetical protein